MTASYLGGTSASILSHFITPLLFLGPLYGQFVRGTLPGQCNWSFREDILSFLFSVTGIRNYLIVSGQISVTTARQWHVNNLPMM